MLIMIVAITIDVAMLVAILVVALLALISSSDIWCTCQLCTTLMYLRVVMLFHMGGPSPPLVIVSLFIRLAQSVSRFVASLWKTITHCWVSFSKSHVSVHLHVTHPAFVPVSLSCSVVHCSSTLLPWFGMHCIAVFTPSDVYFFGFHLAYRDVTLANCYVIPHAFLFHIGIRSLCPYAMPYHMCCTCLSTIPCIVSFHLFVVVSDVSNPYKSLRLLFARTPHPNFQPLLSYLHSFAIVCSRLCSILSPSSDTLCYTGISGHSSLCAEVLNSFRTKAT